MSFSCKRQCTSGTLRLGLDRDGCICGIQGHIDGPSAPYLANSGDNCFGVLKGMIGPYRIPHVDLSGNMWPTTGPEMGAFRGVGAPDGVLIAESLLVEAGAKLGLSQLEVHRCNWVQYSEEFLTLVDDSLMRNDSPEWPMSKLMDQTIAAAGPTPMGRPGKRVGRGIASAKAAFYGEDGTKVLSWTAFSDYCFAQVASLSVRVRDRGTPETHSQFGITPVVCVADVEIDEETGQVQVLQIMHGHDIGEVIHRESARGQVLGSYLMEEFHMKDGHSITPSFAEYLIPTALDIPQKNSVIFYEGNRASDCPYGAKGLGEHGMYCTAAAVANAIFDAIGTVLLKLPITPEKVLRAMGKLS